MTWKRKTPAGSADPMAAVRSLGQRAAFTWDNVKKALGDKPGPKAKASHSKKKRSKYPMPIGK